MIAGLSHLTRSGAYLPQRAVDDAIDYCAVPLTLLYVLGEVRPHKRPFAGTGVAAYRAVEGVPDVGNRQKT